MRRSFVYWGVGSHGVETADSPASAAPTEVQLGPESSDTGEVDLVGADRLVDLYESRYAHFVKLAYLLVDSDEQAEEIVQDAFARALVRHAKIGEPEAYVTRSVVNACYDVLRRRRVERKLMSRLRREETVAEPEYLGDLLAGLPPRERVAMTLRHFDDLSVDQIAVAMDCPAGTVKTLLHRGTARLRGQVEP